MSSAEVIVNVDDGIVTSASSILAPKVNPVFQGAVVLDEDAYLVFEGASPNNFETTLTVVDPGADRTISLPNLSGTLVVAESATFTADATFNGNIIFEGAVADNFETTLTVTEPTEDRVITLPNATTTVVGTDVVQTLTNKTITSPTITTPTVSGLYLSDASITFEGASANDYETTLTVTDPTVADVTITLPATTGTVALTSQLASYQPLDADLTAIGALSGTAGLLKKTAANTWELDTNTYVNSTNLKTGTVTVTLSSGYGSETVSGFLSTQNVIATYKPAAGAYTSSSNTYSIAAETPTDNTTRKFHVKSSSGSDSGSVVLNYIAIA
jgi:hypothetical protein